jgi:hypothetical protein
MSNNHKNNKRGIQKMKKKILKDKIDTLTIKYLILERKYNENKQEIDYLQAQITHLRLNNAGNNTRTTV